ncbi:MAG: HNH endonuclease [Betaproteobacteria bacterium]|nr:HNH endonuclease [Betaproteobacteria bacterium]
MTFDQLYKFIVPVCANCHAMIHRQSPALHPDELSKLLRVTEQ